MRKYRNGNSCSKGNVKVRIRPPSRFGLVLILAAFAAAPNAAKSGGGQCYRFKPERYDSGITVNKEPVCSALMRNFNAFCDEPPMVCELKIHPRFSKLLSQPTWKLVSPTLTLAEIERVIKAPYTAVGRAQAAEESWQFWKPRVELAIDRGSLAVHEAQVDLHNSKRRERVLRVQTGDCTAENHATPDSDHSLMYQTEGIGVNFAPEVFAAHPERGKSWPGSIVFTYKDQTYNYTMGLDTIVVNRSDESTDRLIGRHRNVCIIQLIHRGIK